MQNIRRSDVTGTRNFFKCKKILSKLQEPEQRRPRITEAFLRIQDNNLPNAGFLGKNTQNKRNKVVEIEDNSRENRMKYQKYN